MNGGFNAAAPPAAWNQGQSPYIDPRFAPGYPRSTVSVSPHRGNVYDSSSRMASVSLDPELSGAAPTSATGRSEFEAPADYHRRSASTSSSQRERPGPTPTVANLPPPMPSSRAPHAASAPVSGVPSARSSQSPKSSPTSSSYSVPEGIAASALDKLSAAAASSSPQPPSRHVADSSAAAPPPPPLCPPPPISIHTVRTVQPTTPLPPSLPSLRHETVPKTVPRWTSIVKPCRAAFEVG